jgi:hypothetical protein
MKIDMAPVMALFIASPETWARTVSDPSKTPHIIENIQNARNDTKMEDDIITTNNVINVIIAPIM